MEVPKRDISILPTLFPGSVGLSNPINKNTPAKTQPVPEPAVKLELLKETPTKRTGRPHGAIIDSTVIQAPTEPVVQKVAVSSIAVETVRKCIRIMNDPFSFARDRIFHPPVFRLTSGTWMTTDVSFRIGTSADRGQPNYKDNSSNTHLSSHSAIPYVNSH